MTDTETTDVEVQPRYSARQLGDHTETQVDEIAARVAHYARPWWQRWTKRRE